MTNIIFFFTDQQRWDTCGCYGQPLEITPNLDRMAREGVRFENAFTCQPVCGPARACLQTGKYATETGCYRNDVHLPLNEKTIAHHLSEHGYELGYIGKWHLASNGDAGINHRTAAVPMAHRGGWKDYWLASDVLEFTSHSYDGHMFDRNGERREFPESRYSVDVLTDWALEYLQSRNREKPFFLFISYIEPHHQNDHQRYEGPHGSKERFKDFVIPPDLADKKGDWRENYPDYLGCINSLDQNLGRIMDELKRLRMTEETLIIFTSDHGSHFRTRNSEYKRSCHEACIRIPMVAYGPGFKGGKVIEELVSLIDIPPTLMTAAGIDVPGTMRGKPLQKLVKGSFQGWREEVFLQISESQVGRAIRTKKWKYSVYAPNKDGRNDSAGDLYAEQYLYDLENDPNELNNLVSDPAYKKVRSELAERLKKQMTEAGEKEPVIKTGK